MSKPSIIPNWKYQKPSKAGYKGLKKLLKYVSHRESPDHRAVEINDRWTDCGLGKGWRAVYEHAAKFSGQYVLAHHMVIAPAPDLMALIPEEMRMDLVKEVTERTIEAWHVARGLPIPEFSFVLHDRDTDDDHEMQNLHTHVFIAGTIENNLGERESHRVARQQVCTDRGGLQRDDNIHHIARREFETLLDLSIGQEWRRLREPDSPQIANTLNPSWEIDL
jgi:hypothetical protein